MRKLSPIFLVISAIAVATIAVQAQSTYERYRFTTFAGNPPSIGSADGTGSTARFNYPMRTAVDNVGNIYVADSGNHTIRKATPGGVVTTFAGSPGNSGSADGNVSTARFYFPEGVAFDSSGNLYVADNGNSTHPRFPPGPGDQRAYSRHLPGKSSGSEPGAARGLSFQEASR
jgi:sugar lactone lactonase YvrE